MARPPPPIKATTSISMVMGWRIGESDRIHACVPETSSLLGGRPRTAAFGRLGCNSSCQAAVSPGTLGESHSDCRER